MAKTEGKKGLEEQEGVGIHKLEDDDLMQKAKDGVGKAEEDNMADNNSIESEQQMFQEVEEEQEELAGSKGETIEGSSPEVEIEKLVKEREDLYQRLARLQADFDNFRKRSRKEQEDFARYASQNLVERLLPVLDNFSRALEAEYGDNNSLKAGVEMTYRQLFEVLSQEGLTVIEAKGQTFDPEYHEAVMQEETDEYPDGTVIEVFQKGYKLKNKVIRPAMVKVAKS